ncbi:MAG: SRPBCC family protein [Deltaproteobacteria bacterium]|nr:SRPBCC family protein [Deltaproteobacteria bacterium]
MKAKIFFLFVLLTLSACATLPSSVEDLTPPEELGNIAVLSALGDKLNINYVGATIFGNRHNAADVSEWDIDNFVVKKAEGYLKESGYIVKRISYEKSLLLKAYDIKEPVYGTYSKYVKDYLSKLAEDEGVDTFLVIYSTHQEDYVGHSEERLRGYGLYQRFSMLSAPTTALYSNLRFELIKPKPFRKVTVKKSFDFEFVAPEYFEESYKDQVNEGTLLTIKNKDAAVLAKKLRHSLDGAISKGLSLVGLKIWDPNLEKQVPTATEAARMTEFKARRIVKTYTMNLTSPPEKVFPLLCPARKYEWLEHWKCDMIYSDSGVAENNCVFQTDFPHRGEMTWVVTRYDAPRAIEFTVFSFDFYVLKVDINLKPDGNGGTHANWSHTFTAITERGNRFIAKYTDGDHQKKMSHWEQSLERFCRSGEMLRKNLE